MFYSVNALTAEDVIPRGLFELELEAPLLVSLELLITLPPLSMIPPAAVCAFRSVTGFACSVMDRQSQRLPSMFRSLMYSQN